MRAADFWSIRGSTQQQPSTSNGKNSMLSETLIRRCGSVGGNAPFPRKQRSAMKTRAKYVGVHLNRKDGRKKLKKLELVSKDEEEVAEALFALANMLTGVTNNDDQVPSDDANGSKIADEGNELKRIGSTEINIESDIVDPQRQDPAHEVVHHGSISDSSRNVAMALGMKSNTVEAVSHEQNGAAKSSINSGDLKSEMTNQSLRLSSLSNDSVHISLMHNQTKGNIELNVSRKSLNRCANHVSISRMIKALKLTGKEDHHRPQPKIDLNAGLKDSTETTKMGVFLQKNMLVKDHHQGYNFMYQGRRMGCDAEDSHHKQELLLINNNGGGVGELKKKAFQLQNRFCFPFSSSPSESGSVLLHQYVDPQMGSGKFEGWLRPSNINGEWRRAQHQQQQQQMWTPQVRDLHQQCCVFPLRNGRRRPHP